MAITSIKKLLEECEAMGWTVCSNNDHITLSNSSLLGKFGITVRCDENSTVLDVIKRIENEYTTFDPDAATRKIIINGDPHFVSDILYDMEKRERMMGELYDRLDTYYYS